MRIALYQPEIAYNVGAILRLGACMATPVDLIEPMGFAWDDRRVARAGMDYIDHVTIARHPSWEAFLPGVDGWLVLLTTRADDTLHAFSFRATDILLFGRESAGVPDGVRASAGAAIRIPMAPDLRSLNLSMSVAITLTEALRQTGGMPTRS